MSAYPDMLFDSISAWMVYGVMEGRSIAKLAICAIV